MSRAATTVPGTAAIRSINIRHAACAIASTGCTAAVIRGRITADHGRSSMPASDTSSGQAIARSLHACRAPTAITFDAAIIAVGRPSARVISRIAAS